jgi:protein-L-isoaspartate O-methyltransferase
MPTSEAQAAARLAAVLDAHTGFGDTWRQAFAEMHRGDFLPYLAHFADRTDQWTVNRADDPETWLALAYRPDVSVRIPGEADQIRSSASQPMAMAELLLASRIEPGMKVLEIGSGVGFMAGLLAYAIGALNVTTVDVDASMAATAAENLGKAGHGGVRVVHGDGLALDAEDLAGPFDRILATCSVPHLPEAWVKACPTGRIVAPWITTYDGITTTAVIDMHDGIGTGRFLPGLSFMPALGTRPDDTPAEPIGEIRTSETWLRCPQVTASRKVGASFAVALQLPDVHYATAKTPAGDFGIMVWDENGSWARTSTPDTMDVAQFEVEQAGPRDLWDEVEEAYRRWRSWSRPATDRFGLTTTAGTVEYWLDNPEQPLTAL